MSGNVWALIGAVSVMILVFGAIVFLSQSYTLDGIKSKTVGDGQHGTARWATPREMRQTFHSVLFRPADWREDTNRPKTQGIILGSFSRRKHNGILELFLYNCSITEGGSHMENTVYGYVRVSTKEQNEDRQIR